MEFKKWLEMAIPGPQHLAGVYYHGTSSAEAGLAILKSGINPPDIAFKPNTQLRPILGKVYITPILRYAVVYCLGGDMLGHKMPADIGSRYLFGPTGYLFEIPGSELKDIQPDEDSVGELIYHKSILWLNDLANRIVATSRLRKVMDGEVGYWASVGKQLMRYLSDWQKLELINKGAHIAHTGSLIPSRAWTFDKSKSELLNKDGSNFFELAQQVR